jgi:hypothetical protein
LKDLLFAKSAEGTIILIIIKTKTKAKPPKKAWLLLQPWDRKQKIGMVKSKLYT